MPDAPAPHRVTIIAKAPEGTNTAIDGNEFIVDVTTRLNNAKQGPTPAEARSIADINKILTSARADAEAAAVNGQVAQLSVQIVGHGTVGQLLLGGFWMTDPVKARSNPFYVCDTNPQALQFLITHRGKIADVFLAGCNVGLPVTDHPVVNGRVLTYCLGEALQCRVGGAVQFVADEDFDANTGLYVPPGAGWSWNPAPPSLAWNGAFAPDPIDPHDTTIEIDRVTATHLPFAPGTDPTAKGVSITVNATEIQRPALRYATRETSVTTKEHGAGALVDNGRFFVTPKAQYAVRNSTEVARNVYKQLWGYA